MGTGQAPENPTTMPPSSVLSDTGRPALVGPRSTSTARWWCWTNGGPSAATWVFVLPFLLLPACAPSATVQSGEDIAQELDLPPHEGLPAHIAVGPCENRTGGEGTFTIDDTRISLDDEIGRGMGDMLVSVLANTGRFAVVEANLDVIEALERQREIRGEPEGGSGLASADLMVTCGVTEFEPDASGIGGGVANVVGGTLGAVLGGTSTSRVGIDVRLVDVNTGLVLNAFSVQGEARDVTAGGLAAQRFGPAGALGGFSNTSVDEAVRKALLEAVREIALRTPPQYFEQAGDGAGSREGAPGSGPVEPEKADEVAELQEAEVVFVANRSLNLRADPSMTGEVLVSLSRNAELVVLDRADGWVRVLTEGEEEGWVPEEYVSPHPDT